MSTHTSNSSGIAGRVGDDRRTTEWLSEECYTKADEPLHPSYTGTCCDTYSQKVMNRILYQK